MPRKWPHTPYPNKWSACLARCCNPRFAQRGDEMNVDQKRAEMLDRLSRESADNDLMLQAYGRYWLPLATRIANALEKIEGHLAAWKEGDDDN
jgi:hypothetical protein